MIRAALLVAALLLTGAQEPDRTTRLARCDGRLCGYERPEDITVIDGGRVLVSDERGLWIVDPETGARTKLPADGPVHQGANDARGSRIVAIDSGTPPRILLYERTGDTARLLRAIEAPATAKLNSVTLAADGTIYATNSFEPMPREALLAKFLAREPTGYALRWREGEGWQRLEGTDLSLANGIALSADGALLAIAGTFDQAVLLRSVETGETRRVPVPLQPDNVKPLPDGGFIVAGHTGVPVTGVNGCRPPEATPCGFPFAVATIAADGAVKTIFEHDGTFIPGASVAVPWKGGLLIGSAFGDRLALVPSETLRR